MSGRNNNHSIIFLSVKYLLTVAYIHQNCILFQPFLFDFLCDLVCDDDDNSTASNSNDDYFGFDDICSCGPPAPATTGRKGKPPNVDLNLRKYKFYIHTHIFYYSLSIVWTFKILFLWRCLGLLFIWIILWNLFIWKDLFILQVFHIRHFCIY